LVWNDCPFCHPELDPLQTIALEDEHCLFLLQPQPVLEGSGLIVPRAHRETVFELSEAEILATFRMLRHAKAMLDAQYRPDGYNVGWNCRPVGGQSIPHAHLHVIPRFGDEPFAGRGMRYWLKQPQNRRRGAQGTGGYST
jgi:diadenosine tetraphosphate (Ap4A) HIT family hydrolase